MREGEGEKRRGGEIRYSIVRMDHHIYNFPENIFICNKQSDVQVI